MRFRPIHGLSFVVGAGICPVLFRGKIQSAAVSALHTVKGKRTVAERVLEFGEIVHSRLAPKFKRLGVFYPPQRIVLVGLKQERVLEVWVSGESGQFEHLTTYPVRGASGTLGPKLKKGDRQVPEGIYRIESLNPNSLYHLALRVGYPNQFDRAQGSSDGRNALGSDIMIHGKSASIGCLAMGDQAAEDLFVMTAESGIEKITVILSPVDFRIRSLPANMPKVPPWTAELYAEIRSELMKLTGKSGPPIRSDSANSRSPIQ